MVTIYKLPKYY